MFCGNCGQEILAGNRFCGMCGTPLPQRPLTAPNAQSTVRFIRLPQDRPTSFEATANAVRSNIATASRDGQLSSAVISEDRPGAVSRVVETPPAELPVSETAGDSYEAVEPVQNLAPEPSLERFIEQFKYEPPTESELTMGGTPIPDTEHFRPIFVSPQASGAGIPAPSALDQTNFPANETKTLKPEPVRSGIGLVEPTEDAAERTRFLDLDQPATERPRSGSSMVVGPSFLGLNDAPDAGKYVEEGEPSGSHWRIWLAVLLLAVVGGLGFLEWRSQVKQTSGPLEVIKMQIQRLRHGGVSESATTGAPSSSPTDSKAAAPAMQVEPQAKPPQSTTNVASGTADNGQSGSPAVTQPGGVASQGTSTPNADGRRPSGIAAGDQAPAIANSAPPQSQPVQTVPDQTAPSSTDAKAPDTGTGKNNLKNAASDDDAEVVTRRIVPGQEEMTRADHASDSAATAAWLWKAVAKGNPEAPVRLSEMYVKGQGVPKSCDQALVLLKTAASKQNARARNRLGSMYAAGTCVQRDRVQAYKWMSLALVADPSSEWAQQNRDLLWRQMTPEERTLAAKYQ